MNELSNDSRRDSKRERESTETKGAKLQEGSGGMNIQKHLGLLGLKASDKVTGFVGVVTCVSFDLYGCIQIALTPKVSKGKHGDTSWYDVARIKVTGKNPVMDVPDFKYGGVAEGLKGPAEKPPGRV